MFAAQKNYKYINISAKGSIDIIRPTFFKGLGTQALSLLITPYIFLIYRSLKHPTMSTWRFVTAVPVGLALIMGLALMLCGYLSFGDETEAGTL